MTDFHINELVYLSYFGVRQVGKIIKITPTKVRVSFKNCRGEWREAWRPKDRVVFHENEIREAVEWQS